MNFQSSFWCKKFVEFVVLTSGDKQAAAWKIQFRLGIFEHPTAFGCDKLGLPGVGKSQLEIPLVNYLPGR